jgi:hypothetical protein
MNAARAMGGRLLVVPLTVVLWMSATGATPTAASADDRLSLAVSPAEAKLGDQVTVRLERWESAAVTLTVCGNLGLRGAPDCDLIRGQGVGMRRSGPTLTGLTVAAPPASCPCVVRAASATGSEVQTAPLTIIGVPVGPVVPQGPAPATLAIATDVTDAQRGPVGIVRGLLGGRTDHQLTIVLQNLTTATLSKVTLRAAVGRATGDAQPVALPAVEPLEPGDTRRFDVPASIPAPRWGRHHWHVSADGAGPQVAAQSTSTSTPLLLYLLVALLAGDVTAIAVRKLRHRIRPGRGATR